MSEKISTWMTRGMAGLREIGPYAAAGLLLPGGSVIALLMWLHRHRGKPERRS